MATSSGTTWRRADSSALDLARDLRWRLRQTIRPYARGVARKTMAAIPLEWLLWERERYSRKRQSAGRAVRPSALLRASRFRLVPPEIETYSPPDRPDLRFVNASSAVVQRTFWHGMDGGRVSADGAQVALWERLCASATEIVEVGANIGTLTVPGAKAASAPYRAVEPHPVAASVLRQNVELNGLEHVEIVETAAMPDASRATVELVEPSSDPFPTSTAAAVSEAGGHHFAGRGIRVPAVPIIELVGNADLIKLDVEGMELPLLGALEPFIVERQPTMMIEVLDDNIALREWLSAFVEAHSLQVLAIAADGLKPVPAALLPNTRLVYRYGTRDVLVVPRDGS